MKLSLRVEHSLAVLGLVNLVTASIIPDVNSFRSAMGQLTGRDKSPWPYGVVGDSWGSGVSRTMFYMTKTSLTVFEPSLRDAACSGSHLVDLAKGCYQMGKVGKPNAVVMTSGGNNAGFGRIVDVCIYHSSPATDYGPAYKDDTARTGECAKALDDAKNYITNTMGQDLISTVNDILADPNVKSNSDFLLYLTSYAQFFGTDYDAWCNKEAWNIPGRSATPYLSVELRRAFNDLVSKVNTLYKDTIKNTFPKHAPFVDLDPVFTGHRFCEPGATHKDQFNTETTFDKVYLWNLNWPWQVAGTAAPNADELNGPVSTQEAQQLFGDNGVTAWTGGSGGGGGGNDASNGWRLRPFHPRSSGYTSIKNAILAQLKTDGLPKDAPSSTTSSPPAPSCSHVGSGCKCTDRSTPAPDEDNRCCLHNQPNNKDKCFA